MPNATTRPFAYRIVRYTPNLVRDEWINIGVVIYDRHTGRVAQRIMEEPADFARVRRFHPAADESLLVRLSEEFTLQLAANGGGSLDKLSRWEQALSNTIQFSPQKGLLAEDMDAELDRLYREQVEPRRHTRLIEEVSTRHGIRSRANQVFRSAGIWPNLQRHVRVEDFTFAGDPLRIDYSYRRNGTRGFVQALPLARDPGQAKVLAFTAEAIREKLPQTEFLALTEAAPRPKENPRHQFVSGLLESAGIPIVPLAQLSDWARRIGPALRSA
jgi:hypothetical protein